jgi:hypothetical protein
MDLEQLKYLTPDQKDRYVTLERMFDSKGWAVVEAWAKQRATLEYQRAATASGWDDHRLATGSRLAYEQIANLREATEQEFVDLAEQAMLAEQENEELLSE